MRRPSHQTGWILASVLSAIAACAQGCESDSTPQGPASPTLGPSSPTIGSGSDAGSDAADAGVDGSTCAPTDSCCAYYDLWNGGVSACSSCAQQKVGQCIPIQSTAQGCSPATLTQCEQQCTEQDCACIQKCVGDCLTVTESYWSCLDQACAGCGQ